MNITIPAVHPGLSMYLNIIVTVFGVAGVALQQLTGVFGSSPAGSAIAAAAAIVGAINAALHGLSAAQSGPLVSDPAAGGQLGGNT